MYAEIHSSRQKGVQMHPPLPPLNPPLLVHVFEQMRFHKFQYVYSFLSVYRRNVSPSFHNGCVQLTLLTFKLPFHKNTLHNRIVYGGIKMYHSNIINIVFSREVAIHVRDAFRSVTREQSNRFYHSHTFKQ